MNKSGSDDSEFETSSSSGQLPSPTEELHFLSPRWSFWLHIGILKPFSLNRNMIFKRIETDHGPTA